jgi:cytochrome c556
MSGFVRAGQTFLKALMSGGKQKTTGTEVIKSIKPDVGKLDKIQKGKKRITDITDKYAVGFAQNNPKLLKKFRKNSKKNLDSISKIYENKKDGGRMGLKFGSGSDKKLSAKQMKIASLAGNKKKIDGPDFKKLRAMKSPMDKAVRKS